MLHKEINIYVMLFRFRMYNNLINSKHDRWNTPPVRVIIVANKTFNKISFYRSTNNMSNLLWLLSELEKHHHKGLNKKCSVGHNRNPSANLKENYDWIYKNYEFSV